MNKTILKLLIPLIVVGTFNYSCANEDEILETYGPGNLAEKEAFKGDYINFGYWKDICLTHRITESDRVKASQNLYKLIFAELGNCNNKNILEVGCGIGNGCILLHTQFPQSHVIGLDLTPQQIERAISKHQNYLNQHKTVQFLNAKCDYTTLNNNSLDTIYSIEAAQYFSSIPKFSQEMCRILKLDGRLVITAHFSSSQEAYEKVKELLPTVKNNIDLMIPINNVRQAFTLNGFKEIKFYEIGNYVFEGFNQWTSQIQDVEWGQNIYTAFKENLINYYVIVLEK